MNMTRLLRKDERMTTNDINCAHACKNTCSMLKKAMEREAEFSRYYEELQAVCDYPDVHSFLTDLSNRHRTMMEDIRQKLSQMEARGQILDGVISSFDPAGV